MRTLKVFLIVITTSLVMSCQEKAGSTTTGNPFVTMTMTSSASVATVAKKLWQHILNYIAPSAYAFPPPGMMMDSAGNTVTVSNIWMTVGEIEFKFDETAGGTEVDGEDVDFTGPYSVDMLDTTPTPLQSGRISTALIRRIKVKLVRTTILPSGAPADFLNNSILISGTVNGFSFSYLTHDETVFEVAGPNLVNALENSSLLLELRIANLIKRINLSAITANTQIDDGNRVSATNPCPLIDASANDLFTCFRKGIETESNLGRDDDFDNQLDNGEESVD